MRGLGTIINSAAIVAGGLVGHFTGRFFQEEQQENSQWAVHAGRTMPCLRYHHR